MATRPHRELRETRVINYGDTGYGSDDEVEEPSRKRGRGRGRGGTTTRGTGRGRGRVPRSVPLDLMPVEGTLYDIVRHGRTALSTVVDEWIDAYKLNRDSALLDLIQFFIQCSGCRGRITPEMHESLEYTDIIRKMTEEFDEEGGDYPLMLSGPQWKKFRSNFMEFIMVLVRQCQYSIIYDQYMLDNIISLLTGLSDSQVRAFRHTSTLAAMKLMTALVDVALNLSINLDHTQRQYEAERLKNRNKQGSEERLELLMTKRQEIEENQEEIRNMLTYIFKGVFIHRYRDTQPEIRAICMAEIGSWMKLYPTMFLDDSYLKYVGWTLYDRVGEVRLCCLRCLTPLYDCEDLAPKLELFTNRFKDRIVEMTLDKEYEVAVAAVRLTINILKFNENVLADKDCENVYELVYSSHRAVAQAAGEFLNTKLFTKNFDDETRNMKSKKGKRRSENTPLIRDLVLFFIESELHEHGAYLIDSLWEVAGNGMLKDWECMTDLLLEEPADNEEEMDDKQETSLIELMVCCVKQAATGEYPVGRGQTRKMISKELKLVLEDKIALTEHFIPTLPQLLAKYATDDDRIINLLNIALHFDLEIYTTSRLEKHLDALLKIIQDIVKKRTNTEVLETCAKVLENYCMEEHGIASKSTVARSTLIDYMVEKFREANNVYFQQDGEEPDEDDKYILRSSLQRLCAFYNFHDLNPWNVWNMLYKILKSGLDDNLDISPDIISNAVGCCNFSVMWSLNALDEWNPDKLKVIALSRCLNELLQVCHELLYLNSTQVQASAYITICDLLIVFSRNLGTNPQLKQLVYEPDQSLQSQLAGFLNDRVFIEDDDDDMDENAKIEELHKRRNYLAAFCKLIIYNIIPIKTGADMFMHYMKFYNDYGDIIKATLGKCREINKVLTSKTLAKSLTQLFTDVQNRTGKKNFDRGNEGFQSMKELARRFSLSFGLDQIKNRYAVTAMHSAGINFGLSPMESSEDPAGPPPNLAFLEILSEFACKLMKQDKRTVLSYLESKLPYGIPAGRGEDWAPLMTYRNSLLAGEADIALPTRGFGRGRGRGSIAKRRLGDDDPSVSWMARDAVAAGAMKKRRGRDPESGSEAGSERDYEGMKAKKTSTKNSNKKRKKITSSVLGRKKETSQSPGTAGKSVCGDATTQRNSSPLCKANGRKLLLTDLSKESKRGRKKLPLDFTPMDISVHEEIDGIAKYSRHNSINSDASGNCPLLVENTCNKRLLVVLDDCQPLLKSPYSLRKRSKKPLPTTKDYSLSKLRRNTRNHVNVNIDEGWNNDDMSRDKNCGLNSGESMIPSSAVDENNDNNERDDQLAEYPPDIESEKVDDLKRNGNGLVSEENESGGKDLEENEPGVEDPEEDEPGVEGPEEDEPGVKDPKGNEPGKKGPAVSENLAHPCSVTRIYSRKASRLSLSTKDISGTKKNVSQHNDEHEWKSDGTEQSECSLNNDSFGQKTKGIAYRHDTSQESNVARAKGSKLICFLEKENISNLVSGSNECMPANAMKSAKFHKISMGLSPLKFSKSGIAEEEAAKLKYPMKLQKLSMLKQSRNCVNGENSDENSSYQESLPSSISCKSNVGDSYIKSGEENDIASPEEDFDNSSIDHSLCVTTKKISHLASESIFNKRIASNCHVSSLTSSSKKISKLVCGLIPKNLRDKVTRKRRRVLNEGTDSSSSDVELPISTKRPPKRRHTRSGW